MGLDQVNFKVYEILEERVLLREADVNTVRVLYGKSHPTRAFQGVEFYKWIVKHRNIAEESTQLKMEHDLRTLRVTPEDGPEQIEDKLITIETDWPKVKNFEKTPRAAIKHALAMFDHAHPHSQYVVALQAQMDIGAKGWDTFGAFRMQLVEHFRVGYQRNEIYKSESSGMQAGLSAIQVPGPKPGAGPRNEPINICDHCDLKICSAQKGNPITQCEVCAPTVLAETEKRKNGGIGRRIILLLRAYMAVHKPKAMKGVHVPGGWIKDNAYRPPESDRWESDKPAPVNAPASDTQLAMIELPEGAAGNFGTLWWRPLTTVYSSTWRAMLSTKTLQRHRSLQT